MLQADNKFQLLFHRGHVHGISDCSMCSSGTVSLLAEMAKMKTKYILNAVRCQAQTLLWERSTVT